MDRQHKHNFARRIVIATATLATTVIGFSSQSQAAPAPSGSSAPARSLPRLGESGPHVTALQQALVRHGFTLRGGVTGTFDQNTVRTLVNFQRVVGLKTTGTVDLSTAKVLKLSQAEAVQLQTLAVLPVRGMRNKSVLDLQKALVSAGVTLPGGVDGFFGRGTTAALAAFQGSKDLAVTGTVDAATAAALGLAVPATSNQATAAAVSAAPVVAAATAAVPASTTSKLEAAALPRRGDRSDAVKTLQHALIARGIAVKGGADGVFGGGTAIALQTFQTSQGLTASGQVDYRTALALTLVDEPTVKLAAFPVQGMCSFTDTWHAPRGERLHLGVDIIAPRGKLIYAVADGTITKMYSVGKDANAGNGFRLTMSDGTYFFYGHLDTIAAGITVGVPVKAGQVLGTVGSTGNTSTPHLHFEVHPGGGDAVNPYPIVNAIDECNVTAPRG
jgi:murein DD-endopeptidase MepM/ murein hydrolase activator NlpD